MTPGSLSILLKGIKRKPRSQKSCNILRSRPTDPGHPKGPSIRTCLMFRLKNRARMEQESLAEGSEGGLRELASKWFIEIQAPLILHNGIFPAWFQGFITRKDAEENLRDKELGSFLIRLSDKAIGFILSYKGKERCRHFVINQSKSGQFIISGDTEVHDNLSDLIDYYKTSPIEPFGEYLTSSCFEASNEELYDIIQVSPKEQPVATVRAVTITQHQINTASEQPPARPPKSNRISEEVPPLPRRGGPLESGSLNDQSAQDRVLYAQVEKYLPRGIPRAQHSCQEDFPGEFPGKAERPTTQNQSCRKEDISRCSQGTVYSELILLDSKSRSLPLLDNNSDEEQSYRLSASSLTPPRLSPKPLRQATSHDLPQEKKGTYSRPTSSHRTITQVVHLCNSPVYYLAGRPGSQLTTGDTRSSTSEQDTDLMYAEVPSKVIPVRYPPDNTYEHIPEHGLRGEEATPKPSSNTYESLEGLKPKHTLSAWGIKTDKWKRFFPDVKRK